MSGEVELLAQAEVGQDSVDLLARAELRQDTVDLLSTFRVTCPRRMGDNWQRKMWFDGIYYWRGRYCPTDDRLEFEYIAADGLAGNVWTENPAARISGLLPGCLLADFTVRGEANGIATTIHYSDGFDSYVAESDEASATGWAWENNTPVFDATTTDCYRRVNLGANRTTPIPRLWVIAIFTDDSEGKQWVKARRQTTGGDITGWDAEVDVSNVDNTNMIYGCSVRSMGDAGPLKGDMMVVYKEGTAIRSHYYDGDWDDAIEDVDTTTLPGKAAWDFEHGEALLIDMGHVIYVDDDGSVKWRERGAGVAAVWSAADTLHGAAGHQGVGIVEHGAGWLWTVWVEGEDILEYRVHQCLPEVWYPLLANPALEFDVSTEAVVKTSTVRQPQTPDWVPSGEAVPICWIGETAPTTPCEVGWGILIEFSIASLTGVFAVRQLSSADLYARFEVGQGSAELLGNAIIRQSGSAELLGNAEIQHSGSAELLGNAVVRQSGSAELLGEAEVRQPGSAELLGKFEAQATAELLGNAVVRQSGSAELLGEAEVRQPGSAELLGKAEITHSVELLGNGTIRQSDSAELLGNAVIRHVGTPVELLGNAVVRQSGSAELLGRFEAQATAELLGNAIIRHVGTPVELLSNAVIRHVGTPVELLGNAIIRQSDSAELLGNAIIRHVGTPAELLGNAVIRHMGTPAELLGKVDVQHSGSAELLGNAIIRQSDSAELLGNGVIRHSDIAELLGKEIIRHTDIRELVARCVIRHSATKDLDANVEIVHWEDLYCKSIIRHTATPLNLRAIFWTRFPRRLWTSRRYVNGVIELDEKLLGDASLEYVIEGVMEDTQGYLDNAGLSYSEWTDITLVPVQILRAVTYGTVAALYARHTLTFRSQVIPSITPVTVTVIGDAEKAMNYWEDRMNQMLEFYVTSQGGDVMLTSTLDEEPVFSMEDIPEEVTEFVSWRIWLQERDN